MTNVDDTVEFELPVIPAIDGPALDPSMKGSEHDELLLAEHLRTNVALPHDGAEAFRIAERQTGSNKAATLLMAVEIAMRDLLEHAA